MFHLCRRLCCVAATLLASSLVQTGELQGQDFTFATNNGTLTITGYNGPGGAVIIPNAIYGVPVTAIGEAVFMHNGGLTSVTIPDNVNSIGINAFYDTALTNVTFGNGLICIGESAFGFCMGLKNLIIPNSVVNIENGAFIDCGLNSVTIGNGVTNIGGAAFSFSALFTITISDSVISIGNSAFANCNNLWGVTIGNSVSTIGVNVLGNCQTLTSITIPKSVTSIGESTFSSCTRLTTAFFLGNAPNADSSLFNGDDNATVYYLPGTTGWGATFCGRPTLLWNPQVETTDGSFGVRQNQFGFNITGTPDIPLVVEASDHLPTRSWLALQTCTLTNGQLYFSDPKWNIYRERYYRIRPP